MKTTKQTLQPPPPHRYRLSIQGQINLVLCPLRWSWDISVNGPDTIFSRKHRAGVDIHSCSQFLLELYSQWLIPGSPSNRKTPTILISEVVRSVGELHTFSCFCSPSLTFTLMVILYFSVAAGSVRPVHREEPIWYDVLHTNGTAKTPPTWRRDPQSVPGPCHLQSCCCTGHGDWVYR